MAIRLTESRLRQIIQEERARLVRRPLREGKFSYSSKASLIAALAKAEGILPAAA